MADYQKTTVERTDDPSVNGPRVVSTTSPMYLLQRIVGLVFGIIQAFVVLRIVLLLLGANQRNEIVKAILNVAGVFVDPFQGILRTDRIASSGFILDLTAVVALVAWTLIEILVLAVLRLGGDRQVHPTA
jgi:hypothetical protein